MELARTGWPRAGRSCVRLPAGIGAGVDGDLQPGRRVRRQRGGPVKQRSSIASELGNERKSNVTFRMPPSSRRMPTNVVTSNPIGPPGTAPSTAPDSSYAVIVDGNGGSMRPLPAENPTAVWGVSKMIVSGIPRGVAVHVVRLVQERGRRRARLPVGGEDRRRRPVVEEVQPERGVALGQRAGAGLLERHGAAARPRTGRTPRDPSSRPRRPRPSSGDRPRAPTCCRPGRSRSR